MYVRVVVYFIRVVSAAFVSNMPPYLASISCLLSHNSYTMAFNVHAHTIKIDLLAWAMPLFLVCGCKPTVTLYVHMYTHTQPGGRGSLPSTEDKEGKHNKLYIFM